MGYALVSLFSFSVFSLFFCAFDERNMLFAIETTFYYVKRLVSGCNFHIWLVFHLMKFKWLKSCGRFYFSCHFYCPIACNALLKVFHNHQYEVQMLDKLIAWNAMKSYSSSNSGPFETETTRIYWINDWFPRFAIKTYRNKAPRRDERGW